MALFFSRIKNTPYNEKERLSALKTSACMALKKDGADK